MPINYLRYHPDWKDIIRPQALKRADYKCQNCKVPNRAIIVYDGDGRWLETDPFMRASMERNKQKPIRVILTIAHLNHLVVDNREENLRALCQRCHLNHDKEHHQLMKRLAKITDYATLVNSLKDDHNGSSIPHVFAVYRAKRNTALHLHGIYNKRHAQNCESKYDKDVLKLAEMYTGQATYLLRWACDKLATHYNHPDPLAFYEKYYDSELSLIPKNYTLPEHANIQTQDDRGEYSRS